MRVLVLILVVMLAVPCFAFAQSQGELEIFRIANDSDFISVQRTGASQQEAESLAIEALRETVLQQYASVVSAFGTSQDLSIRTQRRTLPLQAQTLFHRERRNSYRAIAYINKANAEEFIIRYATLPYADRRAYLTASASAPSLSEATSLANSQLINQIVVQISSQQEQVIEERDFEVTSEFRSQARAVSQIQLVGLQQIATRLGDEHFVFVYITREDQEASFATIRSQAETNTRMGDEQMALGNTSLAMMNYYRAYLYSTNYPRAIAFTHADGQQTSSLRESLRLQIMAFLHNMELDAQPAFQIGERDSRVVFTARVNDHRITNVRYSYTQRGVREDKSIRQGQGFIERVQYNPSARVEFFPVTLTLDPSVVANDPILESLLEAHRIEVEREIEMDYSNILRPSIRADIRAGDVFFYIHSPLLQVVSASWDFGDGERAFTPSAEHRYRVADEYKVTLMVNNDPELSDTRYVNLFTGEIHNRPGMIQDNPMIAGMAAELQPTNARASQNTAAQRSGQVSRARQGTVEQAPEVAETTRTPAVERPAVPSVREVPSQQRADSADNRTPSQQRADSADNRTPSQQRATASADVDAAPTSPENRSSRAAGAEQRRSSESVNTSAPRQDYTEIYTELTHYRTAAGLAARLRYLSENGVFIYGSQESFIDSDGALVIIADGNRIKDYLIFRNNRYLNIATGEEITNLSNQYAGMAMLWIMPAS